jgi:hypothetical protein
MKITQLLALAALAFGLQTATAIQVYDSNGAELGQVAKIKCSAPLVCTISAQKLNIAGGGFAVSSGQQTRFSNFKPALLTSGTSTTPSATTVYLTQIYVPANATLTGFAVSNGATVGTNKYVVALFSAAGAKLANSALAGVLTSGADVYQAVPFTSTYSAVGPGVYWVALYVDGTTDRFRTIPAVGAYAGLAGTVTGQTFGTVTSTLTLPTTFTADVGPVGYLY